MSHPKENNWVHVWSIYRFSSEIVFEVIKPPNTPVLFPVLFVSITASLILCVILPILYPIIGVSAIDDSDIPAQFIEFNVTSILPHFLLFFTMPFIIGVFLVLLGTYFFIIGRLFRIENILWEHWLGFAGWINIPMVLMFFGSSLLSAWGHTANPSRIFFFAVLVIFVILPIVWAVVLCVQGLKSWSDKGTSFCVRISLIPYFIFAVMTTPELILVGSLAW
ncbi:MAG: hypothetical protein F4Z01_07730 [Gammaproteobacteria bacterium]|nr:hypothetical protein [Gammaproteobacteria bacterium]MYF39217.1 hypothetical protein [Gammaproteobacteria bacterium]